jgi:hypothetical protein
VLARCTAILHRRGTANVSPHGIQLHRIPAALLRARRQRPVTADQMAGDLAEQWRHAAASLIEAAIPGDTGVPQTWPVCAALLPHAQAALAEHSGGMARLANYLGERGRYGPALELQRRVLGAQERVFGAEHPDALDTRHILARCTGEAGDPAAARNQFAALLPIRERVLGPEHPDTLDTRRSLAYWTGEAGDPAAARDQLTALLAMRERVLGAEHPDTLDTRHDLADWTGEAASPAAARDQLAALLPIRERVLGAEHPDTLDTRHILAYWTGMAGDSAAAREQLAPLPPPAYWTSRRKLRSTM